MQRSTTLTLLACLLGATALSALSALSARGQTLATRPASAPASIAASAPTSAPDNEQPATTQAAEAATLEKEIGNSALAERLASMASGLLRSQQATPAVWRYAAGLLEAATRLAPDDSRMAQYYLEAVSHTGDTKATTQALSAYRKLEPGDEFAQVQQIDLSLAQMDQDGALKGKGSLERKLEYLKTIVAAERSVGPAVRSVAACRCAVLLAERMENEAAWKMVNTAFELNPLNLDALRMKYEQLRMGKPADRVAGQLRMLLANPVQPPVAVGIARELAAMGMVGKSLEWFKLAADLHHALGVRPPGDIGVDYAAELFLSGDARSASAIAQDVTTTNPDDLNAWLLRLVLAKNAGDKAAMDQVIHRAEIALANRLALIRQAAGDTTATTRPIDSPDAVTLPDPAADVQRVQASGRADLMPQLLPVIGGVAWLKIYFENKPAQAQPWVKAVASVSGEGDDVVERLMGWSYLMAGNKDDAKKHLSAVADKDAVAALGLLQLAAQTPEGKKSSVEPARKLLMQNASSLAGALIYGAVASLGVKIQPAAGATDIEQLLKDFPKDWMKILDQPQLFYSLRMEPVRVGVPVGDPMLVKITLTNTSSLPLTMGPEGTIHQDLWIDVQIRGAQPAVYPAEAFARLSGPLVLLPHDSVQQIVRLDRARLARLLESSPTAFFQISARVFTNPITIAGDVTMGPAGTPAQLSKLMERTGAPLGQPMLQKLSAALENGTPTQRVRAVETLNTFATILSGEGGNEAARQLAGQAADAVRRSTTDTDPAVSSWAQYVYCLSTGDQTVLSGLLHDRSWVARTLGVVATDLMGQSHDIVKPLAGGDPDPLVSKIASAALEANLQRPATQPTTAPAGTTLPTQPAAPASPIAMRASDAQAPATRAVAPVAPVVPTSPVVPAVAPPVARAPAGTQPAPK